MSFYDEINEYLSAIKNGDNTMLDSLYELVGNHIAGLALYYLVDKSYCDDVIVETFLKVCLYINSYEEGKSGYKWLRRIAQNVAYNYNEMTAKHSGISELASAVTLADSDFTTHSDEKLDLFQAIDLLEPESRELIYMHFFLRKSLKEIGDELHLSKSKVKRHLDKILLQLKKYIETGNC